MERTTRHVRIGLIGCGQIAQLAHLNIVRALPDARLAAIAETDEERREAARRLAPGTPIVSDFRDLLDLDGIDAVVVSLPPAMHAESAIAAHESGRHVYLEKPLATDLRGAKGVLEAWRASGKVGMIGFNYRFNRLFRETKRVLHGASLGKPVAVRTVFSSAIRPRPEWMRRRESGGGVLLDLGSHHVDMVRFLFGEVSEVACSVHGADSEGDTATLELVLRDGLPVQSFFSHRAADEDRFEIYCEGGSLKIDRRHGLVAEVSSGVDSFHRREQLRHIWRSIRGAGYVMEKRSAFGHEPSWRYALEHFAEAVRGDHPASPDFEDGFRSLEIVLAAEEAARAARWVPIGSSREARPNASGLGGFRRTS
jgi:predicted dehydrogenase